MIYFTYNEFDSPDEPGSGIRMQSIVLFKLENAREIAGIPFIVNSGVRTPERNKEEGGEDDSSHLDGWAADIRCTNNYQRGKILVALILAGFRRIGIGKNFIHGDLDPNKKDCTWLYPIKTEI